MTVDPGYKGTQGSTDSFTQILLWDFVLPVENIPSSNGGRSEAKPAIHAIGAYDVYDIVQSMLK